MGKTKKRRKTKNDGQKSDSASSKSVTSRLQYSTADLLCKAEELIDEFNFDLAEKFCKRALDSEPDNIQALEMYGFLLLQMGDRDQASKCFKRCIELLPDEGHSKYMYMGQMSTDQEAIQYYQKGISLMKSRLSQQAQSNSLAADSVESDSSKEVTVNDISSAYCAIAEIYLTDACTEEEADVRCKENLDLAVETDPNNSEAYHTLASYWLSKSEKQKAAEAMEKGISLWLPSLRNALSPEGAAIEDPVEVCSVSYPARISCSKTLIELENYELASEILELLLDENDEIVEVWYLLGLLNYLRGADFKNNAIHYLKKGLELAAKFKFEDAEMLKQMNDLLAEIDDGNSVSADEEDNDDDDMEANSSSESEDSNDESKMDQ